MFKLEKNELLNNGKCWYRDEYDNTAFMFRKEKGFTAKIRFKDKMITAEPLHINVPPTDEEGANLRMNYPPGALEREDISSGIESFTVLVQHWIDMLYDIQFLGCSEEFLKKVSPGATTDDVNYHKLGRLVEHEELKSLVSSVFEKNPN